MRRKNDALTKNEKEVLEFIQLTNSHEIYGYKLAEIFNIHTGTATRILHSLEQRKFLISELTFTEHSLSRRVYKLSPGV